MQVVIELTGESRELLLRHFSGDGPLQDALRNAGRKEIAGVDVYSLVCDRPQAEQLLEMARNHCPPAVKDIEHALDAANRS